MKNTPARTYAMKDHAMSYSCTIKTNKNSNQFLELLLKYFNLDYNTRLGLSSIQIQWKHYVTHIHMNYLLLLQDVISNHFSQDLLGYPTNYAI